MTFRIIAFVMFIVPSHLMAQGSCCCCLLRDAGQKAERDGNLRTAISEWEDAKKCSDAGKCSDLDRLIASARNKIEVEAREKGQVKQCEEEIARLASQIELLNSEIREKEVKNTNLSNDKEKADKKISEYEDKIWRIIDSTKIIEVYKMYCIEFPNGKYYNLAKQRSGEETNSSTVPELVRIPGGSFQMGNSSTSVQVQTFYLGKFEVTNAQYCIFLNEMGNQIEGGERWINIGGEKNDYSCKIIPKGTKFQVQSGFENHPVAFVTWYGANSYCIWLSKKTGKSYRLPSRAEWEFAAGNGVKHTTYSWGFENPTGKEGGNIIDVSRGKYIKGYACTFTFPYGMYDDGYGFSAPVGSYSPNDFGVYDMSGNVWEWCDAILSNNDNNRNESAAIKGGSWNCEFNERDIRYFKKGKEVYGYNRSSGKRDGSKPKEFDTCKIEFKDYEYKYNYTGVNGYEIANELWNERSFNSATIGFRVSSNSF